MRPHLLGRLLTSETSWTHFFVRGYILCDSGDGTTAGVGAASSVPKTITQIALEQCEDMLTVTVGTKRKSLWSRVSRGEALAVMGEINSVVQDVIDRLDADFTDNSLYLCFEAFDLSAWDTLASDTRNLGTGTDLTVFGGRHVACVLRWGWNVHSKHGL